MTKVWKAVSVAAFGAVVSATVWAQQTNPPLLYVARAQVKPERMTEYLEVQKKITEAYKKGGASLRVVARGTIGNPNEVISVAPMSSYAERDAQTPLRKALTDMEYSALLARRDQCVASVRTTIERTWPELGIAPASGSALPTMIREVRTRVRPGMQPQYMDMVKNELLPAYKKAGLSYLRVRQVQYGGPRTEFTSTWGFEKWAELDSMATFLERTMGADGAKKFQEKLGGLTAYSEYNIWTVVADASYRNQ